MSQAMWSTVDGYLNEKLLPFDDALDEVLKANRAAELPEIDVAPNQGKLLHLIARIHGAKRILEIGTLGGYSTIWLARALPEDGRLISLEFEPRHAEVARGNVGRAGLSGKVEIRVGAALESLAKMKAENIGPFDLIFVDADKPNNPGYLEWAMKFSRVGTVIVVDNVIREGEVANPDSMDEKVIGTRKFFDMLGADDRLEATALQTVGSKGHDGFAVALVNRLD